MIIDFPAYIKSCTDHLESTVLDNEKYYEETTLEKLEEAKKEIKSELDAGLSQSFISEKEFSAMNPTDKGPGKFYEIYKIHKAHDPPNLPPGRPIVSGCGSITENISLFVDVHAKDLVPKLPAFLQDTPDLLRHIETLNQTDIPEGSFPVSIDVTGLYSNIPHEEGLECLNEALDTRQDETVPTNFLVTLMRLVLMLNIFTFNGKYYIQKIGTAMGTRAAVVFANLFMGKIDKLIKSVANGLIFFYKRYIDDILIIWTGTEDSFLEFMAAINALHPTIKFTYTYDIKNKSTTFLDTTVFIKGNKIYTDLYRKETDRVQYLLPSSCHPSHIFNNIPFSLALRLVRICSERHTLLKRCEELKVMLLTRKYPKNIINAAIEKALKLDRNEILKKVIRKPNDRPIFVTTYHPALPGISSILLKHWKTLTRSTVGLRTFPKPPMVAYRQPANLKKTLVRTNLPPDKRAQRLLLGSHKCRKSPCKMCSYVSQEKEFKSSVTGISYKSTNFYNCQTTGVIYLLNCAKCRKQYVGETERRCVDRFKEHILYVNNFKEATGAHFNLPGHSHADLSVHIIEKVTPNTKHFRLERESHWIRTLSTLTPNGLNTKE